MVMTVTGSVCASIVTGKGQENMLLTVANGVWYRQEIRLEGIKTQLPEGECEVLCRWYHWDLKRESKDV